MIPKLGDTSGFDCASDEGDSGDFGTPQKQIQESLTSNMSGSFDGGGPRCMDGYTPPGSRMQRVKVWMRQQWWRRQARRYVDGSSACTASANSVRKAVQALSVKGAEVTQMRKNPATSAEINCA